KHTVFGPDRVSPDARKRLEESLVLVHGGMAQNVGPILEMVTEKYLLRSEKEWAARQQALAIFDEIVGLLQKGNVQGLGAVTPRGTVADLLAADEVLMPRGYYAIQVPGWLKQDRRSFPAARRRELERLGQAARENPDLGGMVELLFDRMLPSAAKTGANRR